LISDSNSTDIVFFYSALVDSLFNTCQTTIPYLLRVMFNPTRLRIVTSNFSIRTRNYLCSLIVNYCFCPGRPLVNNQDKLFFGHASFFLKNKLIRTQIFADLCPEIPQDNFFPKIFQALFSSSGVLTPKTTRASSTFIATTLSFCLLRSSTTSVK